MRTCLRIESSRFPQVVAWRICLFGFLLGIGGRTSIHAQNLLPNPGFEETVECPSEAHDLYLAADWYTNIPIHSGGSGWWNLRDYVHTCDPQVKPWWPPELGEGIVNSFHRWDQSAGLSFTRLIWSELLAVPEK
ncbi:MAG: hypothetical protein AAF399_27735, partial [Bacteroidota bacterium]